jgi:hypothetical protein
MMRNIVKEAREGACGFISVRRGSSSRKFKSWKSSRIKAGGLSERIDELYSPF